MTAHSPAWYDALARSEGHRGYVSADEVLRAERENTIMIDLSEPPPGSVVLVHGRTGTAYQRHHADGLWHSAAGMRYVNWEHLKSLSFEPLIVIYSAPPDTE